MALRCQFYTIDVIDYPSVASALGARRAMLDELFKTSDFISVHVPLIPATRGLINESRLLSMKPSAYLINTARKKAVDQLKASIDEASEVGAQRVAFLSGKDPGDANRPAALDALIKSVKEICK